MSFAKLTRNALVALALVSMVFVPAAMMSAEAQLTYGSQYSQFGPGTYTSQYPYSGNIYGQQYGQQCPAGYYFNSYSRQCVPAQQQPYSSGMQQSCPYGQYFDQYRQQCVPQMMTQGYGY